MAENVMETRMEDTSSTSTSEDTWGEFESEDIVSVPRRCAYDPLTRL